MSALELIALALWSFTVSAAGGLVGLVLGNLRLPLVVLLASSPAAGVGGLLGHLPSGVDWDLFAVGAAAAIPGAYVGSHLTGRLDERALLRACAVVLAIGGLSMLVQAIVG